MRYKKVNYGEIVRLGLKMRKLNGERLELSKFLRWYENNFGIRVDYGEVYRRLNKKGRIGEWRVEDVDIDGVVGRCVVYIV